MILGNRPPVLVSACLMGLECRYDGRDNRCARIDALASRAALVPVCPEQLGGLPTPRTPAERLGARVLTRDGRDVTDAFRRGAEQALRLKEMLGARYALLKARSPSCGARGVYDGSFSGRVIPGEGVAAEALRRAGVRTFTEDEIDELIEILERESHDSI